MRRLGESDPALPLSERRRKELTRANAWYAAAGPRVAARATVRLRAGLLEIRVPDASWGAGIADLLPQIVARFADLSGEPVRGFRLVGPDGPLPASQD